ncbi:MAG: hypothetical protein OXH39_17950 [Candidatus Poribacteria bacterium]|nr:hypothetical protein [Candidatus Poribacteria bacterium]
MYKHLRLTALIMLIALMLTPTSILADQVSSPFRCSECGGEPHIDPAACIKYVHASDCPCADCVEKRESSSSGGSALWEGTKHLLSKIPVVNDLVPALTLLFNPDVNREQGEIIRESGGYMGNTYNGMAEQSQ